MEYKKVPNRFASVRVNTTGCFRFQFRLGKIRSSNRFDKHIVVASDDGRDDVYKTMTLKITLFVAYNGVTKTLSKSSKGYVNIARKSVKKRTRERMSDQEAKDIKAEAREIMPQPSTVNCS
ncbi:hypothetical protein Tco_0278708 [Tanacetum coccineum]